MIMRPLLVGFILALTALAAPSAKAELRIDITRGNVKPIPIAVSELLGGQGNEPQQGKDIARVIAADLLDPVHNGGVVALIAEQADLGVTAGCLVPAQPVESLTRLTDI